MIDFSKIQSLTDISSPTLQDVIADPYEGLSLEAADYQLKEDQRKVRAAEVDKAKCEAAAQTWRGIMSQAETVADQVEPIYHRKAQGQTSRGGSIMVQLSDCHFGATVEGLEERKKPNVYNLDIARRRLAAFAEQVIFHAVSHQAEELVVAMTGDIFDSRVGKERKDKMFNSEATACQAYLHGRDLVFQFIDHLRETELFGAIRIVGISGNEARLYAELGHSHIMASDNWDSLLNADLASRYRGSDVVCEFGVNRYVVDVEGWRCLILHGHQGIDKDLTQVRVQSLLGTHDADFGISGHVHDTKITSKWIRSACLIGEDYYAGDGLALNSRAQQNIYWLAPGRRNTYVVDLQEPDPSITPYELFDYKGAFGSASIVS